MSEWKRDESISEIDDPEGRIMIMFDHEGLRHIRVDDILMLFPNNNIPRALSYLRKLMLNEQHERLKRIEKSIDALLNGLWPQEETS